MLTAIRLSDKKKVIGDQIPKDENAKYICDYCNGAVIHHKSESRIKIGHFKHSHNQPSCLNNTGETEYHSKTKLDIYSYIKEGWCNKLKIIETEEWICNRTIRSDVYIETKQANKIAIEIQTTILTVSEIKRRTEKYELNGIYVLWILPFDRSRFWKYQFQRTGLPRDDENWSWSPSEKVKLKEMEIFLYWAYFKKLFFWDVDHNHSKSFICVEFTEYRNDDVEFWQDGEEHFYHGKTAKTLKAVQSIRYNIKFNQLSVTFAKEFKAPFRDYTIPKRKLFTYQRPKRKSNRS